MARLVTATLFAAGLVSPATQADRLAEALRERLEAGLAAGTLPVRGRAVLARSQLFRFYEARRFRPVWVGPSGASERARELVERLGRAEEVGLRAEDYRLGAIERVLAALEAAAPTAPEWPALAVDAELLLGDAFFLFAAHLARGRVRPETVEPDWRAETEERDLVAALEGIVAAGGSLAELLASLEPKEPGYHRLKRGLADYRAIERGGGWPVVPPGDALRVGDRGARVAALRRRLSIVGDLVAAGGSEAEDVFDEAVESAVRRFQRRHGLAEDGVVGRRTLAALNVSAAERVEQIVVNLERWRWLPPSLGRRYVLVNVPAFELVVVEDGRTVLSMRAVVGRPYRRTPVFSASLTYLVLNPYWHVPPSIAAQDLLPRVRRDPEYLARNGFRVFAGWGADAKEVDPFSVDWSSVDPRRMPYRFRQDPGPSNALGRIKFMMPNPYNVYLHDTPARELFERADRAFSSGCIRLERPLELAELLLRDDPRWTRQSLEAALARGVEQTIRLREPVPVHLLYWTSWVDEEGMAHFREDIYGRDARLAEALRRARPSSVAEGTP